MRERASARGRRPAPTWNRSWVPPRNAWRRWRRICKLHGIIMQPAHPSFIQIETTLACNAECPFCSHSTLTRRPRRMEDWVWRKIVDETRGLGITYRPFLINEPLADHRLADIIRYIRKD